MPTDLDRRNFLFRSGATVGGFLASPKLGVLAAVGSAMAGSQTSSDTDNAIHDKPSANPNRILLRSSEPINTQGQPLGHRIDSAALIPAPAAKQGERLFLVAGHSQARPHDDPRLRRRSLGISVVELQLDQTQGWRHQVSSHHNRRWDAETPIPLEGGRLNAQGKLHRHQTMEAGTTEISALVALPWQTALAAERDGWLVEVNPVTGLAVKRFSLGRLSATALAVSATAGQPVRIYALGTRLYKFVSHQRFDARLLQANSSILLMGELFAADLAQGSWFPITQELSDESWLQRMANIEDTPGLPPPLENPRGLILSADSQLLLTTSTERLTIGDFGAKFQTARKPRETTAMDPQAATTFKVGRFTVEQDALGSGSLIFGS